MTLPSPNRQRVGFLNEIRGPVQTRLSLFAWGMMPLGVGRNPGHREAWREGPLVGIQHSPCRFSLPRSGNFLSWPRFSLGDRLVVGFQ